MCGKRLKQALPLWLPHYYKHHEPPLEEVSSQLLAMSAATIDRLLKPVKSRYGKGLSGTKPGSLLKNIFRLALISGISIKLVLWRPILLHTVGLH